VRITSALFDPALLELPWATPLAEWPADRLVTLPQGISRHVVRFVRLAGVVYAVKETPEAIAQREYDLLRQLERLGAPAVEAVAIVAERAAPARDPAAPPGPARDPAAPPRPARDPAAPPSGLEPVLVTRHLQFSLPYRALFSHTLRTDTMNRLLDALAALLVRLHLSGFFWGDVSLSNTLFRRDAGAFAAYLVDAETGALHGALSRGQRAEDVEIAQVNIFGEMLDLAAGGLLHESIDPEGVAEDVVRRYESLWHELTYEQEVAGVLDMRHHVEKRIRRLNELGFDAGELQLSVDEQSYRVRPKVVDAGHHTRRLLRLTGLDAEENQARKLLNDLDTYRAESDLDDEQQAAHRWLTEVFEPVVRAVPAALRGKLESTELFVQVIEHRWFMSEEVGRDVGLAPAVHSYLADILAHRPDEQAVLGFEVAAGSGLHD